MSRNSKEKREIAKRQRWIAEYLNRGIENRAKIVELLEADHGIEISERTVGYDKKAVHRQWLKDASQSIEEKQARVEADYLYIYHEAMEAWLKSCEDEVTTTEESAVSGPFGKGERAKVSTRRRGQSGNPALLAQAQAAKKAIRELRGLDEERGAGTDDKPFVVKVVRGVSMEDI